MSLAPGIRLGHYNVTPLLGKGGMGQDRSFTLVAGSPL